VVGTQFATDANVKQAVHLHYTADVKALVPWWEKCLKMSIVITCRKPKIYIVPGKQLRLPA
jgi:hypothetical protein